MRRALALILPLPVTPPVNHPGNRSLPGGTRGGGDFDRLEPMLGTVEFVGQGFKD